ncbi:helix-turn-helix domain-containing protein [Halomonas sp. TRM85114]|uniref:GlxA family transcriptional regulator n=1 Tax=Halomonas jincaotanensis TaxID=2810616 RepID=UPI001BD389A9|nr:helix-turn-helix domain-containing protein [Halomonas jincaotanensis]MBS9404575.1 helix-turn-helix domain-containing protein [Halomonas jincaotanensis]
MLIYPQVASVDVCGPLEPFGLANFLTGRRLYDPITASIDGAAVPVAGSFLKLEPTCCCEDLPDRIDLLLIAGGPGCFAAAEDERFTSWIRRLEPRCVRMGSVCTGSTVLLASGITNGHKIATHWLEAMRLQTDNAFSTQVEPDAIFIHSGKFWTSAGMLAGVDLALAVIEADHGRQLALDIARFMVLVMRRQSGQSQFSSQLMADATEDPRIRRVQLYIWENPRADLSLSRLAKRAAMSERSLGRRFKKVTNITISRYIEDVRLSLARRLLEASAQSIQAVADNAGFGTTATLRRVFERRLCVSPSVYKASFGPENAEAHDAIVNDDAMRMDLENVVNGKSVW